MLKRDTGYTLVELMISLSIGLVITAAVVTAYVSSKENTDRTTDVSNMQETGRIAMSVIREDIAMAGFFGHLQQPIRSAGAGKNLLNSFDDDSKPPRINAVAAGNDCNAGSTQNNGILPENLDLPFIWFYAYEATGGNGSVGELPPLSCIVDNGTETIAEDSDVVFIKRAVSREIRLTDKGTFELEPADPKGLYLITEPLSVGMATGEQLVDEINRPFAGELVNQPSAWKYLSRLYYIRLKRKNSQGDSIPTLVRRSLELGAGNEINAQLGAEEDVIEGVEAIHIDYGFDTGSTDERVDRYIPSGQMTEELLNNHSVVSVGIYILVRDIDPTPGFAQTAGERTFRLGLGKEIQKNDDYKRQLISANVLLYNGINASWYESSIVESGGNSSPAPPSTP